MDYKEKYLNGLKEARKTLDSLDENYRCHELTKDDIRVIYSRLFPELAESEDERIRKELIFFLKKEIPQCSIKEHADKLKAFVSYLEKQKEPQAVDISANFDKAEKEKTEFVSGKLFIKCVKSFSDFKAGEYYWLEYIGDDEYNGRSDNILGATYHITPGMLYTCFIQVDGISEGHKFNVGDKVTDGEDIFTISVIGRDCYWVAEHDCLTIPFTYEYRWEKMSDIHWKPTQKQLESIKYLLDKNMPWLSPFAADAREDLRDVYEKMLRL